MTAARVIANHNVAELVAAHQEALLSGSSSSSSSSFLFSWLAVPGPAEPSLHRLGNGWYGVQPSEQ
jgi:hypothetical protein